MELHRFDWQSTVTDAHDDAVVRFGGDFEDGRQSFADGVERMVAAHTEGLREAFKYAEIAVRDHRRLAVHGIVEDCEFAAERFDDALQAEADTERRNAETRAVLHQAGNTKVIGAARA